MTLGERRDGGLGGQPRAGFSQAQSVDESITRPSDDGLTPGLRLSMCMDVGELMDDRIEENETFAQLMQNAIGSIPHPTMLTHDLWAHSIQGTVSRSGGWKHSLTRAVTW